MPQPIIPPNLKNPTGTGLITKRVIGRIGRGAKMINRRVKALFESVPRQRIDADSGMVINSELPDDHYLHVNQNIVYQYQLSAEILAQISREIDAILRQAYMGTTLPVPLSDWYMYTAVDSAYEQGAAQAVTNLAVISEQFTETVQDVVLSQAYVDRVALVRARVFENMDGIIGSVRADLADTLARGMEAGEGPRVIAKQIRERVGVSQSRAERIARTETLTAHRRARWAQAKDTQDRLGIKTKLLHISALSPTTRRTHANRNGNLYSIEEVEQWYAVDGNAINCKCAQTEVLVDDEGAAIDKKAQKRLQEKGDKFFASHPAK